AEPDIDNLGAISAEDESERDSMVVSRGEDLPIEEAPDDAERGVDAGEDMLDQPIPVDDDDEELDEEDAPAEWNVVTWSELIASLRRFDRRRWASCLLPAKEMFIMADAIIELVGPEELPLIVSIFNQIIRPPRDVDTFERRFRGRYNVLQLIARVDDR